MAKVLNFGSLNIDFVYTVSNFVRPGETIQSLGMEIFSGGKGLNQSIALSRGGCETYHAGCVGEKDGQFLIDILNEAGVNTSGIQRLETGTGNAIIQVDSTGENCILLFGGANQKVDQEHIARVITLNDCNDFLLLQNEINNIEFILKKAHERGMKIVFNPAPYHESIHALPLELVDYLIVNEIEGADIAGIQNDDGATILTALCKKFPHTTIVLTLGSKGVMCYDGGKVYLHGSYQVPVVDTTAAGDTFIGFFIACLMRGFDMEKILEFSSKASAITVSRMGAAPAIPTLEEVLHATMTMAEHTSNSSV